MLKIAIVGFGAIGQEVLRNIATEPKLHVTQVIVQNSSLTETIELLHEYPHIMVSSQLQGFPDLIVECAGHAAILEYVIPALRAGVDAVVVSIGALSEDGMVQALEEAALAGNASVQLLSGAIGAIDALSAARYAGLDSVEYIGRKPALAWTGTPADESFDLVSLTEATEIFVGSAREAARLCPKNANVAATLALAGMGMDRTQVRLIADPNSQKNIHTVKARGVFGEFDLMIQGCPLTNNPKTSVLTVYSVVRALMNRVRSISI